MISSIWCYHSRGLQYCSSGDIDARQPLVYITVVSRPILLLLAGVAARWPICRGVAAVKLMLHHFPV